jgi:precorrin-3B methylase
VDHSLRDPLVIEVSDLLPGMEVLQQRRTAFARGQRVVGVVDPNALLCRQLSGCALHPVLFELFLLPA